MTTTSASRPINSSEATFSYAAAASGKNSASSTPTNKSQTNGLIKPLSTAGTLSTQRPVSSASSSTAQNMGGSTAPTTRTSTPQYLPTTAADPHSKMNDDVNSTTTPPVVPSLNLGAGSTPTLPKEDESMTLVSSMLEDKGSSWEKQSQSSNHTENKTSSAGSRTPDVSKGSDLVPAAPPAVNPWKARSENLTAKKPSPPAAPAPTAAKPSASNAIAAKDNAVEPRQADKKKKPFSENQDVSEKEKSKEGSSEVKDISTRELRDRKKSTDVGRVNGPANREDGGVSRKLTRKHQQSEKEAAPVLPPPVTDTESWPTPEIAQDEVEKSKRDKDEKDKTASSGVRAGPKWVSVPITIPHVPPFASRTGRGRGGARGGRDSGSRGGLGAVTLSSSPNGEKHTGGIFGSGAGTENERGRLGSSSGASRGGHQGNKPSKRATSAGGTTQQRRESKGLLPIPPPEKRKDLAAAPEAGEPAVELAQSVKTTSTGTQTHERVRHGPRTDEQNFVTQGDGRQFPENQDRGHQSGNGHTYNSRPERGYSQGFNGGRSDHHGADTSSTHPPRERGFEGGRGRGHRGRGNYHNQQYSNGHNGGHHQNPGPHFTSTPPHFNAHHTNGQYPAQNSQPSHRPFRGGSRSHQGPNNANYNRYPNPNMQPPPPPIFMPAYPLHYDFSMISPTGIPLPIEFPGIIEVIAQINYYFSVDNLCKDMFLRKHMDSDGFVKLSLIAGFARLRSLTVDMNLLREACLRSQEVQLANGIDDFHLRKAVGWETWVLNEKERDPSAQCDQSSWQTGPRQRNQQNNNSGSPLEMSGSAAPFTPGPSRGQNVIAPGAPPFVPSGVFPPVFGTTLSANVPEFSPNAVPFVNGAAEHSRSIQDEFFLEDCQRLVVVTKRPGHTSPLASPSRPRVNGVLTNGTSAPSSPNRPSFGYDFEVGWLLKDDNQSLESETYIHRLYPNALLQAQKQREASGPIRNPEMATLYKFWSHFLCAKFNSLMYNDFRRYAFVDADLSHRFGLECVYKFYEDGLVNREHFHDSLIQDLVTLVKKDAKNGQELGPERLKSLLSNPQLTAEHKQKIESLLDPEIHSALQNGVEVKDDLVESYTT